MSFFSRIRNVVGQKQERRSFALNELDTKLAEYLKYDKGFFVEAGANDGMTQSNTFYFDKYQKWKGLLIEPIPELAEKCRAFRPKCIVANCALVSSEYADNTIEMRFANLMSVVKGGMKDSVEEDLHIAKGVEIQNLESSYTVTVPARTLSSLLDQYNIKNIDLLSLDVEGFELEALKGLDFTRHRPKYMLIEARYRDEIDAYIASNYKVLTTLSHHDILYKLKGA